MNQSTRARAQRAFGASPYSIRKLRSNLDKSGRRWYRTGTRRILFGQYASFPSAAIRPRAFNLSRK
jgi:hypothetical protein